MNTRPSLSPPKRPSPEPEQQVGELLRHAFTLLLGNLISKLKKALNWLQINTLPLLKKLKRRKDLRPYVLTGIIILAIIVLPLFGTKQSPAKKTTSSSADNTSTSYTTSSLPKGTPNFTTLVPTGKNIDSLGGWTRISPPNNDPVYAFVDHVGSITLNVSEQSLPKDMVTDTDTKLAQLAETYGAKEKVTAGPTTFYVGTSGKGPQSIILVKKQLLILIKSSSSLTTDQWVAYINALQ